MNFTKLFGTAVVIQYGIAELLARQIKHAVADNVEAMEIAIL